MALIDPDGLFNGERLRSCSNRARLFWPYFFLACNGYGRFELDLDRLISRAFLTFDPVPVRADLESCLQEYIDNFLLFPYRSGGSYWGQWDVPAGTLPRYQNRSDARSPEPPKEAFDLWKKEYQQKKASGSPCIKFPQFSSSDKISTSKTPISTSKNDFSAQNSARTPFSASKTPISTHGIGIGEGIGVGVGKSISSSASPSEAVTDSIQVLTVNETPPSEKALTPVQPDEPKIPSQASLRELQETWFEQEFWPNYWRKVDKADARKLFGRHAVSVQEKNRIVGAVKAQAPLYFARDPEHRPHAATWLNKKRYNDEIEQLTVRTGHRIARSQQPVAAKPKCEKCADMGNMFAEKLPGMTEDDWLNSAMPCTCPIGQRLAGRSMQLQPVSSLQGIRTSTPKMTQ